MEFVEGTCTQELFAALNLPESLKETWSLNPLGKHCVYSLEKRIVLIIYPTHHGYYPEEYRVLAINGQIMNISEKWSGAQTFEGIVQIGVSPQTDDLSDEFLKSTLRECYGVGKLLNGRHFEIEVVGRPVPPRSPEKLIKYLNQLVIIIGVNFETAIQQFVPFYLSQVELDELINYLKQNKDADLSEPAQQLLRKAIDHKKKL